MSMSGSIPFDTEEILCWGQGMSRSFLLDTEDISKLKTLAQPFVPLHNIFTSLTTIYTNYVTIKLHQNRLNHADYFQFQT